MKKLLFLLFTVPMLLTSCATITNRKQQDLKILSNRPGSKAEVKDSTYSLPATIKVTRSKEDLKVKLITDSITKDYVVKASPNAAFVYGNLAWFHFLPAAYAIDFNSPKRFYYGHKLELNDNDTVTTIVPALARGYINYFTKVYPTKEGQVNISAGIPVANLFYFKPKNEPYQNYGGFFGVVIGIEYYYTSQKFIKLNAGYAIDHEVPIPVGVDNFDAHQKVRVANITLTDNFKFNRFTIGYGLNYAAYTWQLVNEDYTFPTPHPVEGIYADNLRPPMKKNSHGFGLNINAYHQITKGFFAGIVYNPTFLTTFPDTEWRYQHVISLECIYKLKL